MTTNSSNIQWGRWRRTMELATHAEGFVVQKWTRFGYELPTTVSNDFRHHREEKWTRLPQLRIVK